MPGLLRVVLHCNVDSSSMKKTRTPTRNCSLKGNRGPANSKDLNKSQHSLLTWRDEGISSLPNGLEISSEKQEHRVALGMAS